MSLYKGLLAYLVYLYQSLRVVHGNHCEISDCCSDTVDLEQVLIYFMWSLGSRQWPEGDRCLGKHLHRQYLMLIKGCLETPYLLTDRVFSICVPHFQGTEKWNVFLPEQHAFYFIIQLQCLIYYNRWHETKQMAGVAIFVGQSTLNFGD